MNLRKDREHWWTVKAQAMEKVFASGNSRALLQLIHSTGPRKLRVSETVTKNDGSSVHSAQR